MIGRMANLQRLRMTRKIFTTAHGLASPVGGAGVTSHRILLTSLNNHYSHSVFTDLTRGFATKPKDKDNNIQEVKKTINAEEKNKTVAATKKGAAVLDPWIPDENKSGFQILQKGYKVLKSISQVIEEQQDKTINSETQARLEELSG